jgi:hypothetical protein
VRVAGPSGVVVTDLMDAAAIGRALELGEQHAERDAKDLRAFWND